MQRQNNLLPMVVIDGGSVTEVKDVQPLKTLSSMLVIDDGRFTEFNDVQQ